MLAPVNTGQLRNSIKTKSQITQNGAEAQVFTNCEHAPYLEFRNRSKRKRKQHR